MESNASLARWCSLAGIIGIGIGIVLGILGLADPEILIGGPQVYNFGTQLGRIASILNGIAALGFAATFVGFYLIGAVGNGPLGKAATWLSVVGVTGSALSYLHGAMIGVASPLWVLGWLLVLGWPLLTVAALLERRVSTLYALWPLGMVIAIGVVELAIPLNGVTVMIHDAIFGSVSLIILPYLGKPEVRRAIAPGT